MGYDLHITRAEEFFNTKGNEIPLEEWLGYVKRDPTLTLQREGPFPDMVLWSGDQVCGRSEYPDAWLQWLDGYIYTKNPDLPLIRKMVLIARDLNAKVQGDDLEVYLWDHIEIPGSPPMP